MDISSLSVQDITTYLKNVLDTESSLLKQKMVRQEARNCLRFEEPPREEIKKPQLESYSRPLYPSDKIDGTGVFVFYGVLAAAFIIGGIFMFRVTFWCGVLGIGFGAFLIWIIKKGLARNKKIEDSRRQYQNNLREYEEKTAKAKADYARAQCTYAEKIETEEQRYAHALSVARDRYRAAEEQVQQLDKPVEETESVLQKLYDLDIIFPKYRNLPAVCMFYEYFASGRCSELSGPNGAYNLYEAELRQNLIINKLDAIIGSLEGIKQNQFILYTEVKKAANALPMISRDIAALLDSTKEVSHSTTIAAQCAEATKANTDMLKYLAFIKH